MSARYPVLNAWLERMTTKAAHCVPITCTLGWSLAATGKPGEERTFLNFPMQANAAELMRLVIIRAPAELPLIGCAHDSFLIEDTIDRDRASVAEMQEIMREASRDLLDGFELRADCKPARHRALPGPLHGQTRARGRDAALEPVDGAYYGRGRAAWTVCRSTASRYRN